MIPFASLLDFWFGENILDPQHLERQSQLWFEKNQATDRIINEKFAPLLELFRQGRLTAWKTEARGQLALVILTDQVPRNISRGQRESFAFDAAALALATDGVSRGVDNELNLVERVFFYLPFEHSEDVGMQAKSVELYSTLRDQAPPELKSFFELTYDYAVRHKQIIDRFGRFPHRNQILDRRSTPEEVEFLKSPGSSF